MSKVNSSYDYDWISFEAFENWECFEGYVYPYDLDLLKKASEVLEDKGCRRIVALDIYRDWQDAQELAKTSAIPDHLKHYCRVILLSELIPLQGVNAITIDTFAYDLSKVTDGNHRLLAMKYLGWKEFPAFLNGFVDVLDCLKENTDR